MYKHSLGRTSSDVPACFSPLPAASLRFNFGESFSLDTYFCLFGSPSNVILADSLAHWQKAKQNNWRRKAKLLWCNGHTICVNCNWFARSVCTKCCLFAFGQTPWRLISHIGTMCANFGPIYCPAICIRQTLHKPKFCANLSALIYFRAHTAVLAVVDTNKHLEMQRILGFGRNWMCCLCRKTSRW